MKRMMLMMVGMAFFGMMSCSSPVGSSGSVVESVEIQYEGSTVYSSSVELDVELTWSDGSTTQDSLTVQGVPSSDVTETYTWGDVSDSVTVTFEDFRIVNKYYTKKVTGSGENTTVKYTVRVFSEGSYTTYFIKGPDYENYLDDAFIKGTWSTNIDNSGNEPVHILTLGENESFEYTAEIDSMIIDSESEWLSF